MTDGRAVIGVVLVASGAVLAVSGPEPLLTMVHWIVARIGIVLFSAGAVLALWSISAGNARKAPLALAAAGGIVLLIQHGVELSVMLGGTLIGLGALLSAFRFGDVFQDDVDPVHSYRRVVVPGRIVGRPTSRLPRQIRLLAIGVPAHVDLRTAQPGETKFLELILTCWFTSVEIDLPPRWAVVAGRVAATRKVSFAGGLDSSVPITDLEVADHANTLGDIADARSTRYPGPQDVATVGVVIHVAGAFSKVTLVGR